MNSTHTPNHDDAHHDHREFGDHGPEGTHLHDHGLAFDLHRFVAGRVASVQSQVASVANPILSRGVERRDFVRLAVVGGVAAYATVGLRRNASAQTTSTACVDIPEETAGPYPGDGSNGPNVLNASGVVRSDVRSSFGSSKGVAEGVPLTVTMTITDAATCAPAKGWAVYFWHADREGRYSLYSNGVTDQNYLRGVQETDAKGQVTFTTVFPGCYDGRWPHIHYEVFPSLAAAGDVTKKIATSQIALPKAACDAAYATSGYSASVPNLARVSLATDGIFSDDTTGRQLAVVTGNATTGFVATNSITVSNTVKASSGMGGGPMGGQPPAGGPGGAGAPGAIPTTVATTTTKAAATKTTTKSTTKQTATTKKSTAKKAATTKKKTAAKVTTTLKRS